MSKEKIKVYLYIRVSTTMQIDGYSLDPDILFPVHIKLGNIFALFTKKIFPDSY